MYKSLAALSVAAALMFAVPQSASALPGQTNGIKNSEATNVVKGAVGVTATGGIATGAIVVDTVTAITTGAVVRTQGRRREPIGDKIGDVVPVHLLSVLLFESCNFPV